MFGRAKTNLDFEVAHKVSVTCGSYLRTSLQYISRSLRGWKHRVKREITIWVSDESSIVLSSGWFDMLNEILCIQWTKHLIWVVTNFIGGSLFLGVGDGTKAQERITVDWTNRNPSVPALSPVHTQFAPIGTTAAFHTPFAQTAGTSTERWVESECWT